MQKTVLVVDDHNSVGNVLAQMLQVLGHEPHVFCTASQALDWLEERRPDLAFLDMKMPGIDGLTLLAQMREKGHTFPVVAITGYPEAGVVRQAKDLGAFAVVIKPVSIDVLQGLVEFSENQPFPAPAAPPPEAAVHGAA